MGLGHAQPSALILAGIMENAGAMMASGSISTDVSQGDSGLVTVPQDIRKEV